MKTIKNKMPKIITALTVILWIPLAASAADMWDETPDLNSDAGSPAFIAESYTFKTESPKIDMWAKTPNLDAGRQNHGVKIDGDYKVVSNFNSEMYAETPGLDNNVPAQQPQTPESTLLAKEK